MAEVTYAKQFLNLLDNRSTKLSSDYVGDPKTLPAAPAYILPRMPKPLSKRPRPSQTSANPSSTATPTQPTLTVTLKPLRQPPGPVTLETVTAQTSIYDLKTQYAAQTGYAPDKVKILWERKPVADSKTVGEVIGAAAEKGGSVEMGAMFMGPPTLEPVVPGEGKDSGVAGGEKAGNTDEQQGSEPMDVETGAAQETGGEEVLETKEFWDDLREFVVQKVANKEVAAELFRGFRESWRTGGQGK